MAAKTKIVFATSNANKMKEVKRLFPDSYEIVSLKDIGFTADIAETGKTIEENSRLKAQTIFDAFQLPVMAEDTGLEVDALDGAPGVYSARYAGEDGDSEKNMDLLLKNLDGAASRKAQFKTVATFLSKESSIQVEGIVRGEILPARKGEDGFGYDPIFTAAGFDKSFAEMTAEEKNCISHRGIAMKRLMKALE